MVHPCSQDEEVLLADCKKTRQRRSGPGGQHRNKVETAIRLQHVPSGISAQASERRAQGENLKQAIFRLRVELALNFRNGEDLFEATKRIEDSPLWRARRQGSKISVNPHHRDFPVLLADVLEVLTLTDWDHKETAQTLSVSSSQLIRFLKLEPRALDMLNQKRQENGMRPLS